MGSSVTRRGFLKVAAAGGAGTVLAWPAVVQHAAAAEGSVDVCLTICNHWSYIGIGWQLGIESCVVSVTDGMEMVDRPPHAKTCINLDARAYEFMAEKFPEVTERLKKYLAAGKLELIAGTYAQPMGTTISGEANIRQMVMGRDTIRKALGYEVVRRSSKRRSSPIRRSRSLPSWPATAMRAWPRSIPGAAPVVRAWTSTWSSGKGSTGPRCSACRRTGCSASRPT